MGWKFRKIFAKGQAALDANHFDAAEAAFSEVINIDPHFPEALLHRAYTRFRMGKLEEALSDIDRGVSLRAENAVMHMIRGEVLLEMKRLLEAYDALKTSCELERDNGRALYHWGRAAKLLGRKYEASDLYERAIQFERDYCLAQEMTHFGHN